jgi:hypothetical protein
LLLMVVPRLMLLLLVVVPYFMLLLFNVVIWFILLLFVVIPCLALLLLAMVPCLTLLLAMVPRFTLFACCGSFLSPYVIVACYGALPLPCIVIVSSLHIFFEYSPHPPLCYCYLLWFVTFCLVMLLHVCWGDLSLCALWCCCMFVEVIRMEHGWWDLNILQRKMNILVKTRLSSKL